MTHQLRLAVLGFPQASFDEAPLLISHQKRLALLYFLAVEPAPQPRARLAALFWPSLPADRAKTNLRSALTQLQRVLDPLLEVTTVEVRLNKQLCWIDSDIFPQLLLQAQEQSTPFDYTLVDLYRGPFLAGFPVQAAPLFEQWRNNKQLEFHTLAIEKWADLADGYYRAEEYTAALTLNQKILWLDRLNEAAHQRQMITYLATGQYALAIHQYHVYARSLLKETEQKPSALTETLLQEALAHAKPPEQPDGTAFPLADYAINVPSHSFQPHFSLPAPATKILGRQQQIQRILTKLKNDQERLITLVGLSGTGKTVLAQAVGSLLNQTFKNGVCFVPLASIEPSGQATTTELRIALLLKAKLNIEDNQNDVMAALEFFLRDKELLLIFDNCEHVINGMTLIPRLLSAAPKLRILTTSHTPLHFTSEALEPVAGLALPEPAALLEALLLSPAAQLFIHRAQQVQAHFFATAENSAAINRICHLVAGLPLGIELAAAWVTLYTPAEIAGMIQRQPDFLASSYTDYPDRHHSLQTLFTNMWQLLSEEEQRVFGSMAIFIGDAGRDAVRHVIKAHDTVLTVLLQRGLIRMDSNNRFSCHPLMREMARKQISGHLEQTSLQEAYCVYYADKLTQLFPSPGSTPPQKEALQAAEMDLDNLLSAWHWAVSTYRTDLLIGRLERLVEFFSHRERLQEGEILLSDALAHLQSAAPEHKTAEQVALLGRLQKYLGQLNHKRGHFQLAQRNLEQALDLLRTTSTVPDSEFALGQVFLAYSLALQKPSPLALNLVQQAVTALRNTPERVYLVDALLTESSIHHLENDLTAAQALCQEALQTAKQARYALGIAKALTNLGYMAAMQGKLLEAKAAWEQCLVIFRAETAWRSVAQVLNNLGYASVLERDFRQAEQFLLESLALTRQLGLVSVEAYVLDSLGRAAFETRSFSVARQYYMQALQLVLETGYERKCLDYFLRIAAADLEASFHKYVPSLLVFVQQHPSCSSPQQQEASDLQRRLQEQIATEEMQRLTQLSLGETVQAVAQALSAAPR